MRLSYIVASLLACQFIGGQGRAAFVSPTQWQRAVDIRSTYQEWDRFDSPAGPNAPNIPNVPVGASVTAAPFNPVGVANVLDNSGASFVTSGGNIYSPTAVVDVDSTIPNYDAPSANWTTLIVQTRTQGTSIDLNSLQVVADSVAYQPIDSALLFTQVLGGFGGVLEDRWFQFTIPGNSASYLVQFNGAGSSMSLDKLSVDSVWTAAQASIVEPNPVPEPTTWALAICGLACALATRLHAARRRS
jgi:hypothetical protein